MFATFIPEIVDILGTRSKYGGAYKKEHGKRCVDLCIYGHIWVSFDPNNTDLRRRFERIFCRMVYMLSRMFKRPREGRHTRVLGCNGTCVTL